MSSYRTDLTALQVDALTMCLRNEEDVGEPIVESAPVLDRRYRQYPGRVVGALVAYGFVRPLPGAVLIGERPGDRQLARFAITKAGRRYLATGSGRRRRTA